MEVGYNLPQNEPNLLSQFQLAYFDSWSIFFKNWNEAANVLATCLSNQMTPWRHIRMWHYDIVFVFKNGHYFIKRTT